jgi:hypothetical protein
MSSIIKVARSRLLYTEILLLVDANSRVGSIASPVIGPLGIETENDAGMLFRVFLETNQIFASSTFHCSGTTWCGSRGHRRRIDYIGCSENLHNAIQGACTDASVDLAPGSRQDHTLVIAEADISKLGVVEPPRKVRRFSINKTMLNDYYAVNQFQNLMWQFRQ